MYSNREQSVELERENEEHASFDGDKDKKFPNIATMSEIEQIILDGGFFVHQSQCKDPTTALI